jgi:hypothetical protein
VRYNYRRHGARFLLQGVYGILLHSMSRYNTRVLLTEKERFYISRMLDRIDFMLQNFWGDSYKEAIREEEERT